MLDNSDSCLALSGGIGGAKLALGLSRCLPGKRLTVVANTGDDFELFGLQISPDVDTLLYTLAGINNTELGWGRRDESWNFHAACGELGMDTWFRLGDRDLAVHLYRSMRLKEGASPGTVVSELCRRFRVDVNIVPMSDDPVRTVLESDRGTLSFQEYFVKKRCEPAVSAIRFEGIERAVPSKELLDKLDDPALKMIIICPSNPFLSIQPILSLPGLTSKIQSSGRPVVVVSPLISGESIKGPTSKLFRELDLECNVKTVAAIYRDIATDIIIDNSDAGMAAEIAANGIKVHITGIYMRDDRDKVNLARELLRLHVQSGRDRGTG